jgi:predicted ester cyclase
MSVAANKALVRRYIDDVWNKRAYAVIAESVAADVVNHADPRAIPGIERWKQAVLRIHAAFPDVTVTIDDLVGEGDKVVVRVTMAGTHIGPPGRIAPTGRRVRWTETHILRLADGKIAEQWAAFDSLGLLQQLGAIPTAPP